jgi:hypothetical protein
MTYQDQLDDEAAGIPPAVFLECHDTHQRPGRDCTEAL